MHIVKKFQEHQVCLLTQAFQYLIEHVQ